jgi:hypothetical protein
VKDDAAQQGDEADEAKRIGASQLIPGVLRTRRWRRSTELRTARQSRLAARRIIDGVILASAVMAELACTAPPGGGVWGNVRDSSGRPIAGAEVRLTTQPRLLGFRLPLVDPIRMNTTTQDDGYFLVMWTHGDPDEGPLLEVVKPGFAPATARLGLGHLRCQISLARGAADSLPSEASCGREGSPKVGS